LGKIASIFAAPALLALTLTLPVMVTPYENPYSHEEKTQGSEGRLVDFEEEGIERALIAEEEVQEDMHEMKFNKWLMAAQCALGPLFCVWVLFGAFVH
jgi:sodium/potassium/calcium exchanger 6